MRSFFPSPKRKPDDGAFCLLLFSECWEENASSRIIFFWNHWCSNFLVAQFRKWSQTIIMLQWLILHYFQSPADASVEKLKTGTPFCLRPTNWKIRGELSIWKCPDRLFQNTQHISVNGSKYFTLQILPASFYPPFLALFTWESLCCYLSWFSSMKALARTWSSFSMEIFRRETLFCVSSEVDAYLPRVLAFCSMCNMVTATF